MPDFFNSVAKREIFVGFSLNDSSLNLYFYGQKTICTNLVKYITSKDAKFQNSVSKWWVLSEISILIGLKRFWLNRKKIFRTRNNIYCFTVYIHVFEDEEFNGIIFKNLRSIGLPDCRDRIGIIFYLSNFNNLFFLL